jgi:AraC-like DNA-binding protein
MRFPVSNHRFLGFFPPYRTFEVLQQPGEIPRGPLPTRGVALLWNLRTEDWGRGFRLVRERPPGVALFLILPPASEMGGVGTLLDLMEHCRPHTVLPCMDHLDPEEMLAFLRRPPSEFAVEVMDYLTWRGIEVDLDTRRILRRIFHLSGDLRTIKGLSRAMYMSRRALGRRLMSRGLPAPSHWLHLGRVLRACLCLQNSSATLHSIGCQLGYPDGFALSNQMKRLTGLRPSLMKECFGWEWIVESWLRREAMDGTLSPLLKASLFPEQERQERPVPVLSAASGRAGGQVLRVAEVKRTP